MDRCDCDRPSLGDDRYTHRDSCPRSPRKAATAGEEGALLCKVKWVPRCLKPLACGGKCVLRDGHEVPCECAGDNPGEPGTCPA